MNSMNDRQGKFLGFFLPSKLGNKKNFTVFSFLPYWKFGKFPRFFPWRKEKTTPKGGMCFSFQIDGHGEKRLGKGGSKVAPFLSNPLSFHVT